MLIKQFVDEGLGNSSYLLASEETGQGVIIEKHPSSSIARKRIAAQSPCRCWPARVIVPWRCSTAVSRGGRRRTSR
jgi:hypothetical protein